MKTKQRCWISERCSRARSTILVYAQSREEAESKLRSGQYDAVDVQYYDICRAKIVRESKST